jgi:outer membrane PBP1 activator LpoA protein
VDQRDTSSGRQGDHDAFATSSRDSIASSNGRPLILGTRNRRTRRVQEAYLRAWRNLPGLQRSGSLRRLASIVDGQRLPRCHAPATTAAIEVELEPDRADDR